MKQIKCKRCNHKWFKRTPKNPTICPKCKSPYWNRQATKRKSSTTGLEYERVIFTKEDREKLAEKCGWLCVYCGEDLKKSPKKLSIEHIIQKYLGGNDSEENLTICCRSCNAARGRGTVEQHKEYIKEKLEKIRKRNERAHD